MTAQRFTFWNGEEIGASPQTKKLILSWAGRVTSAKLTVVFQGKFGWELQEVVFNGHTFKAERKIDPLEATLLGPLATGNPTNMITAVDVLNDLVNGDNILDLNYTYNVITTAVGDKTTVTAYIDIEADTTVTNVPDVTGAIGNTIKSLAGASWQFVILLLVLAIVGFVAYKALRRFVL